MWSREKKYSGGREGGREECDADCTIRKKGGGGGGGETNRWRNRGREACLNQSVREGREEEDEQQMEGNMTR